MPEPAARRGVFEARAWCRADLAGGTLDIWPLGVIHRGSRTINVAIGVAARVRLARAEAYRVEQGESVVEAESLDELLDHPDTVLLAHLGRALDLPPSSIQIETESPRGAGLGGSSALGVAFIAAVESMLEVESPPDRRAAVIRDIEARLMQLPTGRQDQYPALLGGALEIRYRPGGEEVRRLDVDLSELGARLVVAYTGRSHFSGASNWKVIRRRLDGDEEAIELFEGISGVSRELVQALEEAHWESVGDLVDREWAFRRRLSPEVSTEKIEHLLTVAKGAGAWGGKATGAGGGGCVAVLCQPEVRRAVAEALAGAGATVLEAPPVEDGVFVERL